MHGQVPEGLDQRRPPALSFGPLDGQHVIGEDRPEGLGRHGSDFEPFGGQLDSQVCCLDEEGKRFVSVKVCARCVHVRASYKCRCLRQNQFAGYQQLTEVRASRVLLLNDSNIYEGAKK